MPDVEAAERYLARLRPGVRLYPAQRELVRRVTAHRAETPTPEAAA